MECNYRQQEGYWYYKVILVKVRTGDYCVIKGPEEEKQLADILQNDYNSTKYYKIIQLLGAEVVQKEFQKEFQLIFSMEHILEEFRNGKTVLEYVYSRNVDGCWKEVSTRVYPRTGQGEQIEEFMIYVTVRTET